VAEASRYRFRTCSAGTEWRPGRQHLRRTLRRMERRPPASMLLLKFTVAFVMAAIAFPSLAYASSPTWFVTPLVTAPGTWGIASTLSCATQLDCVAVGLSYGSGSSSGFVPAAAVEVNGSWSAFAPVSAVETRFGLESVSCWAVGKCLAVGTRYPGGSLVGYELDGSTWVTSDPPTPPERTLRAADVSVSCVAGGPCRVMGLVSITPRGATKWAYVQVFHAGKWNTSRFLAPPNAYRLGSIACTSTQQCAALLDTGRGNVQHSYLDLYSGTAWRATVPAGWSNFDAMRLSCVTSTTCVAIGGGSIVSQESQGWGLRDVVPLGSRPLSARCSPSSCLVTSDTPQTQEGGPDPGGPIWTLQGGTWTPASAPTPTGMISVVFFDSSCAATCTLAGSGTVTGDGGFRDLPVVATSN
jgi:hypothetical protein